MMFQRILVALDSTPLSESVLAPAGILAKRCGAEVVLVRTILGSAPAGQGQHSVPLPAMVEAQAYLERLVSCLRGDGLAVQTAMPLRTPTEGILEQVEALHIDLLVMVTHGRSGLYSLVHPSITWQVLSKSPVPVLVWRGIEARDAAAQPYPSHRFMTDATAPILVPLDGSLQAEQALPIAEELAHLFLHHVEDVTDLSGQRAERWRRLDSCFTLDFTYTTGISVRSSTKARYRQWMTHKLASWIDQFGTSGCVGCGRCITWCPVGIDLTEETRAIRESSGACSVSGTEE